VRGSYQGAGYPTRVEEKSCAEEEEEEGKKTAKCSVSRKVLTEDEWATRKKDAAVAQARVRIVLPRKTRDTDTRKKTKKPK
jgi:hypothetical protein